MPLPKGFIKKVKLVNPKVGPERRQELLDDIDNQGTFLPRGVEYEDMDKTFIESIEKDFDLTLNGEKVPVILLSIQKWTEFSKTWEHTDKYKNIKMPFITIVRRPDIQVGTNQGGNWNETGIKKYSYVKVPTFEGGRKGVDLYKIPQPTSVDITYDVRLFCNRMKDLNKFNTIVQLLFQSKQHYIFPNEHPMPVLLESVSDESKTDDFDKRKFYVQLFEMKLLGYILNEDDYELVPTVNRMVINEEIIIPKITKTVRIKRVENSRNINYSFLIKPRTNNRFNFNAEYDINFTTLTTNNLDSIIFMVNGAVKVIPFIVMSSDIITVKFVKDFDATSDFTLNGIII